MKNVGIDAKDVPRYFRVIVHGDDWRDQSTRLLTDTEMTEGAENVKAAYAAIGKNVTVDYYPL